MRTAPRPPALIGRRGAGPRPGTRAALWAAPPAPAPGASRRPRCGGRLRPSALCAAPRRAPTCLGGVRRSVRVPFRAPQRPILADAAPPGPSALQSATPTSVGDGQERRVRGAADTSPCPLTYSDIGAEPRKMRSFPRSSLGSCASVKWVEPLSPPCGRLLTPFQRCQLGLLGQLASGRGFSHLGLVVPRSTDPLPTAPPARKQYLDMVRARPPGPGAPLWPVDLEPTTEASGAHKRPGQGLPALSRPPG